MNSFVFIGIIFVLSCILAPLLLSGVKWWFRKRGNLDRPHLYKIEGNRAPMPYGVGIVVFLLFLLLVPIIFAFGDFSHLLEKRLMWIILLGSIITVVTFIDDLDTIGRSKWKVPPIVRLLLQIGVGTIIGITSIKISYVSTIFGNILSLESIVWQIHTYEFYLLPIIFTILWYVLIFNAVNFSDGIPGMTGGFAFISFIILGILAIKLYYSDTSIATQENSRFILTILAILIPVTFFLTRSDIARTGIMGDSGTMMLGFFMATLAIVAGGKIATMTLILGVYIIDAIYVIVWRILHGQNPMKGGQTTHIHYRLLELGLSASQIRGIIYFLTIVFGLTAILMPTASGKILLFITIAGITLFLSIILEKVTKKQHTKKITEPDLESLEE